MSLQTYLPTDGARRARQIRLGIIRIEAPPPGIDPSPYWPSMWMYDLVFGIPREGDPLFLSIRKIQEEVAEHFDLTIQTLLSDRRNRYVAHARHVAMYLCREFSKHSLPKVGRCFGGRDHTTVLHGVRKIASYIKRGDSKVIQEINAIKLRLFQ